MRCAYMSGKVSMVFNRNCFAILCITTFLMFAKNDRLFKGRRPTGSHVHRESGSTKKWHEIDIWLLHTTNRKYHSGISRNNGIFLWNFLPNSGLRKFRRGKSIALSTKLIDGRACELYYIYNGRRVVAERTWCNTRRSTAMIYLHYFHVLWICCTTCSHSSATVDKMTRFRLI